ncbi:hypothetical protein [Arcobacter sp. CECT 9188]|uniref:hypothetical protein n=1 Tax=Arcobacter sp. CECT 9188 TaxID=2044505 RepID=UPI000DE895EE|nr:hypothetical protein [Arcobacter sp. CECT 9188]RBQ25781.1 hypothetical protein CRU88_10720 [Arcobacter sp. CECT 9188]
MDQIIEKQFNIKDMLFNNGIVNLYQFLKESNFELEYELNQNQLILKFNSQKETEIYNQILNSFLKDNKIVYQTNNDRWYFDEVKMDFILDKKFDTKGGQKNDLRNGVYLYKKISELGLSREEVERLYLQFCNRMNIKPEVEPNGKLKVPNKKDEIIIAITWDQAIERFSNYFVSTDILSIDSKIHSFEDGQNYFHDMLKQAKNYKIDKWNALIYWFGGRIKRFYNYSYFIYPNSSNLEALNKFKESLKIDDNRIEYKDKENKMITTSSNIDFFQTLSNDEITNKHFYISNNSEEFEVKFFMYLFSIIYHIEEEAKFFEDSDLGSLFDEDVEEYSKMLFELLQYLSFVIYTDDGTFKTSLNEYTKAYKLIQFFQILKEVDLFKYLSDIFQIFSLSQKKNELNLNLKNWCDKLLNFQDLREEYYLASFNILKNDSKGFGKTLFDFEKNYLNYIGDKNMNIHKNSKIVGDSIGHFCAEIGDKDLLFKLRNVKNYKQMVSYFKDLKFSSLKNEKESRFNKEFNDSLENILETVETDWEIARDYIAIYAIDKFKIVDFAKKSK